MAISKYTLYKYVKVNGTWRYCKAVYHDNAKIKPDVVFVNAKEGLVEKHPEGRYYMSHNGGWIDAGTDALEAQRKRKQRAGARRIQPPQRKRLCEKHRRFSRRIRQDHIGSGCRKVFRQLRSPRS